jgi:hypothetical protein
MTVLELITQLIELEEQHPGKTVKGQLNFGPAPNELIGGLLLWEFPNDDIE